MLEKINQKNYIVFEENPSYLSPQADTVKYQDYSVFY